jgi:hypothetical protein
LGTELLRVVEASITAIGENPFQFPVIYKSARRAVLHQLLELCKFIHMKRSSWVMACGVTSEGRWQQDWLPCGLTGRAKGSVMGIDWTISDLQDS